MKLILLLEKYKTLTNDSHIKWMCDEIIRMYVHEPWMDAKINYVMKLGELMKTFDYYNKLRTDILQRNIRRVSTSQTTGYVKIRMCTWTTNPLLNKEETG